MPKELLYAVLLAFCAKNFFSVRFISIDGLPLTIT